jgi:hypothetical protein
MSRRVCQAQGLAAQVAVVRQEVAAVVQEQPVVEVAQRLELAYA